MKDIFHENKAEQPPADGASAEALSGGQVQGRPTFDQESVFFPLSSVPPAGLSLCVWEAEDADT